MSIYSKKSGLEFDIKNSALIYSKDDFTPAVEWTKTLEAGKYAYLDNTKEIIQNTKEQETLYFGNRYMEKTSDENIFTSNDFMADLTVINPGKVGDEFIKTVGHYHGNVPGFDIAYPEVYEAVSGKFEYLLQSEPDKDGAVDVIWVVAEEGDKVVMPPGYGHVSMNVGDEPAVEIDIQKRDNPNQSDYSMFKDNVGGAVYRTADGLVENPKYKIKSLRIVQPKEVPAWGLTSDVALYTSFVNNPEKFEWLIKPQNYKFNLDELFKDIEL